MNFVVIPTWIIFLATYAGLALGKVPGLRMDRAGIALVGATLMLTTGVLGFDEAVSGRSIDFKTLFLLFGMMVVVGVLRISGFFERLTAAALERISSPRGLLAMTIGLSGVLSAFLINDVVCVALTPLVLRLARRMKFDPTPHMIGLATAANIGSTGTITGNPQNIYIGAHSGISYPRFAARLMPIAIVCLVINFLVVAVVFRSRLSAKRGPQESNDDARARSNKSSHSRRDGRFRRLQRKAVLVTLAAIGLFFTGLPLELVALGAAAIMLLDRINPRKIYREIDWSLLIMFTGLFIVVHAFQIHVVDHWRISTWTWLLDRPTDMLSLVSAGLSNVVSNVPAVLLLEPVVQAMPSASRESGWLALAMSSTLAGNLTVLGSVANLIVVEIASREGTTVSLWDYCKVGVPLTLITLAVGIGWLTFAHY